MSKNSKIISVVTTFRNTQSTDALKSYGEEKVKHTIQKFVHQDTEAHLVLAVEKNRQIAEITFHSDGANFTCKEESGDLYTAIDAMINTLTSQLRKHKEKLTRHH